ncbi:MAG: hypothetical protein KAS39_06200 [Actinomycetia bacterium]|nr:hypothetical protein [Actinomycetes bacterium]
MKKKNFLFLGIILTMLAAGIMLFMGCSITQVDPAESSPCYGVTPEESKICTIIANPQDLAVLLKIANIMALKQDLYKAESAIMVLDTIINSLEPGIMMYSELYQMMDTWIDPLVFVILNDYRKQFVSLDLMILPLDREMILLHLNEQKLLIQLAIAGDDQSRRYGDMETDCRYGEWAEDKEGGSGGFRWKPRPAITGTMG